MAEDSYKTLYAQFPDLRIVPTASLVPHELHDARRAEPLTRRLRQDGTLMNPPIVTPLDTDGERFLILDGINRVVAIENLGIPHIIVQVVPYERPHVEIDTWRHVVSGVESAQLRSHFESLPGLDARLGDIFHARSALARRAIVAYCILPGERALTLGGSGLDLRQRNQFLHDIVSSYIKTGRLNRASIDNPEQLLALYPDLAAVIIFPRYEPVEVLELARNGLHIPSGVTRHLISGRALRLHYPLDRLNAPVPLEVKHREFQAWLQGKLEKKQVRYYAEPTYMFDE
jgi:hypothetical protein